MNKRKFNKKAKSGSSQYSQEEIVYLLTQLFSPEDDVSEDERQKIARRLIPLGQRKIQPFLLCLADQNPVVRAGAVHILAQSGRQKVCHPLIEMLKHEQNTVVICQLLRALGELSADGAQALVEPYTKHSASNVRWFAIEALGLLLEQQEDEAPTINALITALKDEDEELRAAAAMALANAADDSIIAPLAEASRDSHHNVRWSAVYALGHSYDPSVIPILVTALSDLSEQIRLVVVDGLSHISIIDSDSVIDPLVRALHDPDPSVQWRAAEVLDELGHPEHLAALQEV